ncbi:MAG: VWA domain-containing protein [Dehalococcoidia bacterium]
MPSRPTGPADPTALLQDGRALAAFLAQAPSQRRGTLPENLLAFCAMLRLAGIHVTVGSTIEAARALEVVDLRRPDDVRAALAATLLSEAAARPLFDALFRVFWSLLAPPPAILPPAGALGGSRSVDGPAARQEQRTLTGDGAGAGTRSVTRGQPRSYSDADMVTSRDFSTLRGDELREVRRLIRVLARRLSTAVSRHSTAHRRGREVDLRRSLRLAARHGGEVRELERRHRVPRRTDLVVLADVSGSMDVYAQFLVQFVYALQQELRGVSTFVFSTRLFEVTPMLRARSFEEALRLVEERVDGWSGGTQIGRSLADFNRRFARDRVHRNTIVVIVSDGWDRGESESLRREMAALARRARRVIWLNPLLGQEGYEPLTRGMSAALPFCDDFMPVHSVDSLAAFGRHLLTVSRQ